MMRPISGYWILEIKVLSYNVAGIKNKLQYNDFFQYIAYFLIFILSETFLEAKLDAVEVKFKDFVLRWAPENEQVVE